MNNFYGLFHTDIPAINCATVLCALPTCKPGEIIKIPEGQCCPQCVSNDGDPDCSAVSCLLPTCKEGQELEVPDGECCPVCVPVTPDCSAVSCLLVACEEGEQLEVLEGECSVFNYCYYFPVHFLCLPYFQCYVIVRMACAAYVLYCLLFCLMRTYCSVFYIYTYVIVHFNNSVLN